MSDNLINWFYEISPHFKGIYETTALLVALSLIYVLLKMEHKI